MRLTSIFSCIMTMISNFRIFYLSNIYFQIFLCKYKNSCCSFVINIIFFFLKLVIFAAYSFKDLQNLLMRYLPLYTSRLFPMFFDTANTEKPDAICSLTFFVSEFSGLFLHPSILSIKHSA